MVNLLSKYMRTEHQYPLSTTNHQPFSNVLNFKKKIFNENKQIIFLTSCISFICDEWLFAPKPNLIHSISLQINLRTFFILTKFF